MADFLTEMSFWAGSEEMMMSTSSSLDITYGLGQISRFATQAAYNQYHPVSIGIVPVSGQRCWSDYLLCVG